MKSRKKLVGVVDVTVLRDTDVKQHLLGAADEYLYISGLAVSKRFRSVFSLDPSYPSFIAFN